MCTLAALLVSLSLASAPQEVDGFQRSVLTLPDDGTLVALRDMDGSGRLDLIFVEDAGLGIRYLRADGGYPQTHDAFFAWPAENVGWSLVDLDGDGRTEIVCLVSGAEVRVWNAAGLPEPGTPKSAAFGEGTLLLNVEGHLPRGVFRMRFLRDIDADGRLDMVVPGLGRYAIYRRLEDGGWADPIDVELEIEIDYDFGDPGELDSSFGQEVRIPWFRLEDVTGDGHIDLVAETDDEVFFHLATPELSTEPTWTLDKAALRDELGEAEEIDFDNLLAEAGRQVDWKVHDLDGKGANDLILQIGGKIRVYLDGSLTGPDESPDQLLKSSGIVMCFYLRDTNGDELVDLQLCRGQEISLARVLRWLILPGSFDLDVYTYENRGGEFTTKPTRRNTLSIEFPRLLSFMKQMEEMEQELEAMVDIPTRRADLASDGVADDVIDIRDQALVVYLGKAPKDDNPMSEFEGDDFDGFFEDFLLDELDGVEDGGTKTFDLGNIDEWAHIQGVGLREACAELEPDRRAPLVPGLDQATIYVRDLDRDGKQDFVVAGMDGGTHVLQFLVDRTP